MQQLHFTYFNDTSLPVQIIKKYKQCNNYILIILTTPVVPVKIINKYKQCNNYILLILTTLDVPVQIINKYKQCKNSSAKIYLCTWNFKALLHKKKSWTYEPIISYTMSKPYNISNNDVVKCRG
jgi:hypothetical protein